MDDPKTMGEQFQAAADSRPDRYTLAWWRQQFDEVKRGYAGANHGINRCNAEYVECWEAVKALRKRVDSLDAGLEAARAELGKLHETVEKARAAFVALKREGGNDV